ncbi:MAG: acyl-CoA dehydrogenase family protein, partial [Pseudomonadota bacterium]|nr:acyl-CoA dehydrogenase family protein [Pseudomonadota bacterium]
MNKTTRTSSSSATAKRLTEAAIRFSADYLAPAAADWEAAGEVPREAFREAARHGLTGVLVPREFGGQELGFAEAVPILETLAGANAAFAFALWVHNNSANALARSAGSTAAKDVLPAMLSGEKLGAFCLTEPEKGSDATGITTFAKESKSGWTLTGTKSWVTNGTRADLLTVYAQTKKGAGARGIAACLVRADSDGFSRGEAYSLPGAMAFGLSDVSFDKCRIAPDAILLPPGDGFRAAMTGINQARTFVGALCCGM